MHDSGLLNGDLDRRGGGTGEPGRRGTGTHGPPPAGVRGWTVATVGGRWITPHFRLTHFRRAFTHTSHRTILLA